MKTKEELKMIIERYELALEYIMLLANIKDVHLGHPRLSDKKCIYCMAFFAINNGDYGYNISTDEYKELITNLNES